MAHASGIAVDCVAEGVVRSNTRKRSADPAQMRDLESLGHFQKPGDADTGRNPSDKRILAQTMCAFEIAK
jgi:hypothetical protein